LGNIGCIANFEEEDEDLMEENGLVVAAKEIADAVGD
jgi:hypothetical protein